MKYADWPTKEEAAQRIGVSVKTVERLADDKKLQQKFRPRPGGTPLAVFHPGDVERIASERAAGAARPFVMPPEAVIPSPASTLPALRQPSLEPGAFAELLGAAIARALSAVKPSDLIFTPDEAAIYSKRSKITLGRLRIEGKLPNAGSKRHPLYRREDLDKL